MPMQITISINGRTIHEFEIVNRGPSLGDREWMNRQQSDSDGWRQYDWTDQAPSHNYRSGTVDHKRGQGALVLAEEVLAAAVDMKGEEE